MSINISKVSISSIAWPLFFILGSGFLFYRTAALVCGGALEYQTLWVSALLFLESIVDLACLLTSMYWLLHSDKSYSLWPVRLCIAMILIHALRVLIFVLGRLEPFENFDVKPSESMIHHTRWSWPDVYVAGILAALSVIVLLIIWYYNKRKK